MSKKTKQVTGRLSSKGFTLIEILIVIGMIAILATIVLIAINPARQFAQARNTQRANDVNAILNAIGQYTADNRGTVPAAITATVQTVSQSGADLCSVLVPTYISALSVDPQATNPAPITDCTGAYTTDYQVSKDSNGRVTVSAATHAELGQTISVTR